MSSSFDAVVIGAGHNGLVAAAFLAKAGLKTVVLERADRVGGCIAMDEIAPGFRCPTLAHRGGLRRDIIRALDLEKLGLRRISTAARVCAPTTDGRALTLWSDTAAAARSIETFSPRDAAAYPRFIESVARITRVLRQFLNEMPPDIDRVGADDLASLLKSLRAFRSLGRTDAYRLLRWLPMPVRDLVDEWFESEPLRATAAADGVFGSYAGPRSAGSGALLLLLASQDGHPVAPGWTTAAGIGTIAESLAAACRAKGVDIRTGAEVARILVSDEGAKGVALANGNEIAARFVVSSCDPKRTFLGLMDPLWLEPSFVRRVEHIRTRGTLAKVNFAVAARPEFNGLGSAGDEERRAALSGCVRLAGDVNAIERAFDAAKYGRFSDEPWIELAIPSIADPQLAPPASHVVSAYVQFVPQFLQEGSWDTERVRLASVVTDTIERYAPGFSRTVVAQQVLTPGDLEMQWGLSGGQIFQGELALDQLLLARPLLGWARHETPIRGLYLCGAGTHPGTGIDGTSGALASRVVIRAAKRS